MDPCFIVFECILGAALLVAAWLSFGRPAMVGLLVFLGAANGACAAFVPVLPAAWRVLASIGFALPLSAIAGVLVRRGRA